MSPHIDPDLGIEISHWNAGSLHLAGLDEAGRGAWAGPVAAGAVILPPDPGLTELLRGVRDSKQMTPLQRGSWAVKIKTAAAAWGVGMASAQEIDTLGILPATRLAMQRALEMLCISAQHLLIDAVRLPQIDLPQTVLIKGDVHSLSIAAASVLAKTSRDEWMCDLNKVYPQYAFQRHKGYGTRVHQATLQQFGVCPEHRRTFAPVRNLLEV